MNRKAVFGIMVTMLLVGTFTIFGVQPDGAGGTNNIYIRTYLPNQWIDGGNPMGWHADDGMWSYSLPFQFPFYGMYYSTIYISSNGLITFLAPDSSYSNSISGLAGKLAIAPAWDDWRTNYLPENDIYIWQPDSNHVIIRWDAVAYDDPSVVANFEAILGADGVIRFNFGYNNGPISATVGISNGVDDVLAEDITASDYIESIVFEPFVDWWAVDWWPMFRHDPYHTGYTPFLAPNTNNTVWNYTTGSGVFSSPAVVDCKVFVGSDDYNVYALNKVTGRPIWNYTTGNRTFSSPAVADGMVFVGSDDYNVYALNETTGNLVWNYTTGSRVQSSPAVAGGMVFVGSDDYNVYALNETTGNLVWNYTTGSRVTSSPAVVDSMVFVGSTDSKIYALNETTGDLIWNYTTGGWVLSSPAVADGMVFVGSNDHNLYALNKTTGDLVWNYTTGGWVVSSPAIACGMVFVGSYDNKVYASNETTGTLIWSYTTGGKVGSSPAVADGMVFIGSEDRKLYAFDSRKNPPACSRNCLVVLTLGMVGSWPDGASVQGGTLPTLDPAFSNFTFKVIDFPSLSAATISYSDTVVLVVSYTTDISGLSSSQKTLLNDFVYNGGKLIIYDSETTPSVDYSWLVYPMATKNPGAMGYSRSPIVFVENNSLGSTDPLSPYYINVTTAPAGAWSDYVGDCNTFATADPNWCGDIKAQNYYSDPNSPGYDGSAANWTHTYAQYGDGIIIYNGFDIDPMSKDTVPSSIGVGNCARIWLMELQQPWGPYWNLPCGHRVVRGDVATIRITPSSTNVTLGQSVMIDVTVENQGNYTETFNVDVFLSVYANTTLLGSQTVSSLAPGAKTTLTYTWNTTRFLTGPYKITAIAQTVPGEIDTVDNAYTYGMVRVQTGNMHTLSVFNRPAWSFLLPFTINNTRNVAPWTGGLNEDLYVISVPATIADNGIIYDFAHWEDNTTDPTRTLNLTGDRDIYAYYEVSTQPQSIIYLSPIVVSAQPQANFTVKLEVANMTDLYSWTVKLYYDTWFMDLADVYEGAFLSSINMTVFEVVEFDDMFNATHGFIWLNCSLVGSPSGVNGNGTLATFTFTATASGNSVLKLSEIELSNSGGYTISPVTLEGVGLIRIKLLADVNNDGLVDIFDVVLAARSYTARKGEEPSSVHSGYNPHVDVVPEFGLINIFDIVKIASHYGEVDP